MLKVLEHGENVERKVNSSDTRWEQITLLESESFQRARICTFSVKDNGSERG